MELTGSLARRRRREEQLAGAGRRGDSWVEGSSARLGGGGDWRGGAGFGGGGDRRGGAGLGGGGAARWRGGAVEEAGEEEANADEYRGARLRIMGEGAVVAPIPLGIGL